MMSSSAMRQSKLFISDGSKSSTCKKSADYSESRVSLNGRHDNKHRQISLSPTRRAPKVGLIRSLVNSMNSDITDVNEEDDVLKITSQSPGSSPSKRPKLSPLDSSSSQSFPPVSQFSSLLMAASNNPGKVVRSNARNESKFRQSAASKSTRNRLIGSSNYGIKIEVSDDEDTEEKDVYKLEGNSYIKHRYSYSSDEILNARSPEEKREFEIESMMSLIHNTESIMNEARERDAKLKENLLKRRRDTFPSSVPNSDDYLDESVTSSQILDLELEESKLKKASGERLFKTLSINQLDACPLCGTLLSETTRSQFSDLKDSLQRSYAICTAHRNESVISEGHKRGYPKSFDDDQLGLRVKKYSTQILDIITGKRKSKLADRAKNRMLSTKVRRLDALGSMETATIDTLPGYYGLRGLGVIMTAILQLHEKSIRSIARTERWITKMSITGYACHILVPEVAVWLIMEDMNISNEIDAEKIRIESSEYGQAYFAKDINDADSDLASEGDKNESDFQSYGSGNIEIPYDERSCSKVIELGLNDKYSAERNLPAHILSSSPPVNSTSEMSNPENGALIIEIDDEIGMLECPMALNNKDSAFRRIATIDPVKEDTKMATALINEADATAIPHELNSENRIAQVDLLHAYT
ncbi:RTC4-like domain-containing protein [Dipodascopsis uninucleata]